MPFARFSNDRPDIQRCGQRENKAGKENARSCEFKLSVLSVVEVSRADLHEEKNGEDHIAHGKNNIVDYRLNLALGSIPSILDCTCHIACGKGRTATSRTQKRILTVFFFIGFIRYYLQSLFGFLFRLSFGLGY